MASDTNSSDSRIDTKPLEIGMTGMSLVSGLPEPNRKETGSTISSTPPTEDETTANNGSRSNATRGTAAHASEPPPSPSNNSDKNSVTGGGSAGGSRGSAYGSSSRQPPGMGMPSPIGKPGHNKTASNVTSTTSPLLTLTPNSSVDGNSEWTTRHPSPQGEAPAMPFLSSEHQRMSAGDQGGDTGSMGSYEHQQEQDNDGLLGLGALRDRTQSSGSGHFSSSPPVTRGHLPSHENPIDPRGRRDRPPLSQSYNDGASSHGGGSVGERSTGSAPGLQFQQSGGSGFDSGDPRGLGAIGRPELRQSSSGHEYDPPIRSAGSADGFSLPPSQNGVFADPQQGSHLSQKFGTLPSLNTHIQQQRGGYIPQQQQHSHEMSKPRHVRSASHGGGQIDPRVYSQQQFAQSAGGMPHQRASVAGHPSISSSYGESNNIQYSTQKRNSLPNFSSSTQGGYGHQHPALDRRDALDFQQQQQQHQQGSHHGLQMTEDMRLVGGPSALVSPGQSPHQIHYGSHNHPQSDAPPTILSSSPMSMGNTMVRNHSVPMTITRQGSLGATVTSVGDEDLQHPLIGENIEVPADHYSDAQFLMNAQGGGGGGGMIRASGHGHSLSMGELPNHYIDAAGSHHHLPTAGAALPLPKVVYSVKFKRTQRNFVLGPRITRDLKIGTYVKVEADRGEDLGIVVGKVPADKFNFASRNQYTAGMGPPGGMGGSTAADLKRIIRLATHDEVSLLGIKREEEEELLKICRGKVRQRGLPMNVVDAEYQFDRHKLTFFFEAEGRVDFRELVRDLFSMYKTRIWMQQLDKNTSTSAQAIISPQANLQMDYGTPIIAPASEFADSIPLNGMGI